jgi:hypothetical protein
MRCRPQGQGSRSHCGACRGTARSRRHDGGAAAEHLPPSGRWTGRSENCLRHLVALPHPDVTYFLSRPRLTDLRRPRVRRCEADDVAPGALLRAARRHRVRSDARGGSQLAADPQPAPSRHPGPGGGSFVSAAPTRAAPTRPERRQGNESEERTRENNTTPHGPPPGPGTPAADAGVTASTWPDGAWGTTTGPANVAPTSPAPGLRIRMNSARRWSVRNGPTAGPAPRGRLRAQPRAGVVHHPGTSPSGQGTGLQNRQRGFESLRPCGAMV